MPIGRPSIPRESLFLTIASGYSLGVRGGRKFVMELQCIGAAVVWRGSISTRGVDAPTFNRRDQAGHGRYRASDVWNAKTLPECYGARRDEGGVSPHSAILLKRVL